MFDFTDKRKLNPRLVNLTRPHSAAAQRYERLRLAVESAHHDGTGVVVGVASPCAGEGKTLTALNLAGALAQNPACKVALVELDLRSTQNTLKDYLGLGKWAPAGVVDCVVDNAVSKAVDWEQLAHYVPEFNLSLIPSGKRTLSPYEVLNSAQLGELLSQARQRFDFIIVDTAPVTLYPDTQLISRWVDKFIVLVTAGMTSRKQLADCLDMMAPDKVLGLVFNGSKYATGERHGH